MTPPAVGLLLFVLASQQAGLPPTAGAARVSGRVVAQGSSMPIADAHVVLSPSRPRIGVSTEPGKAITDQNGQFLFDRVAAGEYLVNVGKTGYVLFPGVGGSPYTIQVSDGQAMEGMTISLQIGGTIAGRLLDVTGAPVVNTIVMALRRMPVSATTSQYFPVSGSSVQITDLGEFRLDGLAPGAYIVVASPRGKSPFDGPYGGRAVRPPDPAFSGIIDPALRGIMDVTTFYPGTSDRAAAQTIAVSAGQTVENIVFTMQWTHVFAISGVVVDENGDGVPGADVMVTGDTPAFLRSPLSSKSRGDGHFVIYGVPTGPYRLTANVPVTVRPGIREPGSPSTPIEVSVAGADVADLRVVVKR